MTITIEWHIDKEQEQEELVATGEHEGKMYQVAIDPDLPLNDVALSMIQFVFNCAWAEPAVNPRCISRLQPIPV